jgi:tetratricopeptide (TPR) repeat protein
MKSKKNKHSASQFPKIFRFITENKFLKQFLASINKLLFYLNSNPRLKKLTIISYVLFMLLIISLIITGAFNTYKNFQTFKNVSLKREELTEGIKLWQSIAEKYPGYKDAYFKIASMEYQIGDYKKAKQSVGKALVLDPNFSNARTLEKIINLNY